ncbi:unnamed protein product [Sphagnum compactum]
METRSWLYFDPEYETIGMRVRTPRVVVYNDAYEDVTLVKVWISQSVGCFAILSNKVAACAKQFVGDGGTRKGINENDTVISYDGLVSIHMRPYFDAITKGLS